ncbi:unnamed protein product [Oppiella nova]|uniref:N-acetyl-D-glucosamine kinase n=1 Tax=Oppiella nova TaxID=334625 RepID=A0A7R9QVP6_9ACAR|nr:unnamed protein product [Oppiella nova]CAG2177355.1 unnamed protein product [Oppiella nova]
MNVFGGLEGGASLSKIVLLSAEGHVLASDESGPATNHWMIGVDECFARIARMVADALRMAALPADTRLAALGLCLSGCEDEAANAEMAAQFERRYPSVARACVVASDTLGSLLTATPSGGVVLIAGTGSNCLLFNPDQSHVKCGGWGHVLGDWGAAFQIANEAIKTVIEVEENFRREEHDVSGVRDVVFRHFSVHKTSELLTPIYAHFDKTSFAALCRPLALRESFPSINSVYCLLSPAVAVEKDDPLAKALFRRAAVDLAKHVNAVLPSAHPSLLSLPGGLPVVCVGSVFKSWPLLRDGFFATLSPTIRELSLRRLTTSSSFGAAFLASKLNAQTMRMHFDANSELLDRFSRQQYEKR